MHKSSTMIDVLAVEANQIAASTANNAIDGAIKYQLIVACHNLAVRKMGTNKTCE
jgi:hypothetical protein